MKIADGSAPSGAQLGFFYRKILWPDERPAGTVSFFAPLKSVSSVVREMDLVRLVRDDVLQKGTEEDATCALAEQVIERN